MRRARGHTESGFTLVELTIVVVISTITLIAVYQTLITQERTYRYQSAAIDAQGSTRVGLQVLAAELREISASAGANALRGGSDLLVAERDSIRFRAFRKVGIACVIDAAREEIHVWVPGTRFAAGDTLMMFQEGDTLSDADDRWAVGIRLPGVNASSNATLCSAEWGDYATQALQGLSPIALESMDRGALVRSYNTLTYGAYRWEDEWVLGRRESGGAVVPLVGPVLPPREGGVAFRYFDADGQVLTPSSEAERARVSLVEITLRALSPDGPNQQSYVDSLSTNVYLRGN